MKFYRRLTPVKAMTFDLDDTLYDNHPYIVKAEQQMFAFMIKHWPEVESIGKAGWRQFRRESIRENPLFAHDMIALRRAVLDKLFTALDLSGDEKQQAINDSYDTFFWYRSHFTIAAHYVETLLKLKGQIPLIAITNGNVDISRVGLGDCFDKVYHASISQPGKPHVAMFERARQYLALPAENILHVGDNLEKDVFGALNAGYQAAWFAVNRPMALADEAVTQLPHVELTSFSDLLSLV